MKITRRQLRKLIEASVKLSDEEKKAIDDSKKAAIKKIAAASPGVEEEEVAAAYKMSKEETTEALERLSESMKKEITLSQADKAIVSCLKKEGGAAGMGMLVDAVQSLETKTKKLPKKLSSKAKIKNYIKKHPAVLTHKYKDIILIKGLPKAKLQEALEKIGFYKKYSYGLDDVPDKTKAHDDIIGHT